MFKDLPLIPESASTVSWQVDALYYLLALVSIFFTVVVLAAVVYFAVKYRRRHEDEHPAQYEPFHWLENAFIGGMAVIFLALFVIAAKVYFVVQRPPDDALNVYATGRQWMWKFQHIGGQSEINELHVPLNRPVKLTMASEDVIHSLYFPAFRVKRDVLPSRFTEVWFQATKPGKYHIFCAEYCGTEHSA
jgi:cytochrome c oxidase subunit 2